MFASFYSFTKKGTPAMQVENSLAYVYGAETSSGSARLVEPQYIFGIEQEYISAVGHDLGLVCPHPATIGSLNFEERLAPPLVTSITADFFEFVYAGLDDYQRMCHAALHEKLLKLSGLPSTDVHFLILNALAGSTGVFIPYYGRADSYGFYLWFERQNYMHALTSKYDPKKRRITMPRIYASDTAKLVNLKSDMGIEVKAARDANSLDDAADVLDLVQSFEGVTSAFHYSKGVIITHRDHNRPIRLNALVFKPDYREAELTEELGKLKRISPEQCEAEFSRIRGNRAKRHWSRFGEPRLRWTIESHPYLQKYQPNKNEQPRLLSDSGRNWNRAIEIDRDFGAAIDRLIVRVRSVGTNIRSLPTIPSEHLEEAPDRVGGNETVVALLRKGIGVLQGASQSLGCAIDQPDQPATEPRATNCIPGGANEICGQFDGAIQRVGIAPLGLPTSINDLFDLVARIYATKEIPVDRVKWFQNGSTLALNPALFPWLRLVDPGHDDELDELVNALKSIGSYRASNRSFLLHDAAQNGTIPLVPSYLVTEPNLRLRDDKGRTVFHVAAQFGHLEQLPPELITLERLLDQDDDNLTPLAHAIRSGLCNRVPSAAVDFEKCVAGLHKAENLDIDASLVSFARNIQSPEAIEFLEAITLGLDLERTAERNPPFDRNN